MHDRTSRDYLKALLGEIWTLNVFQVRAHTEKRRAEGEDSISLPNAYIIMKNMLVGM